MIRFKYKLHPQIIELINDTVYDNSGPDYEGFIYGILEEGSKYQLKSLSLYLVCRTSESNGIRLYTNPTVVAAKNDYDAIRIFGEDNDSPGSVMCKLEDNAYTAKVYPV